MSIKRTIITAIVGLTLVALVAPAVIPAKADTLSDLMAQITALTAQLNALRGGTTTTTTTTTTTGTGACAGVTFSRNLTVGATGSDVKCLQVILNSKGFTVSATGAGSPGSETTYFGGKTLAAVKEYQESKGFTPANQVGPMTRAALNADMGGVVVNPGNPNPVYTGSISATTAYDTPASGAVVSGQATADLLHINFTGTGIVTSVTLQRSGISDQNTLTNVYLFDGNTRITDGYSFNVNGQLVMNGLAINVNGSHTISVRADVYSLAYATASSIAVGLTGYTANGSAANVSVMGNPQMVVIGALAAVNLGANTLTAYTSASPATINAGTSQYTVWSAPVQVNTRAVLLKMANFKMVGSAPSNALGNIKLFVDGVDTGRVASVITISGSSYASFDLTSAPITMTTGSHTVDVRADIVTGASRTVQLSLQQASDLTITDPQIGVNIAVLGPSGAAFTANSGAYISINTGTGTVVVDPAFTSATNVSAGATNAVIGKFVIHGYGEDVKVNSILVTPSITGEASTTGTTTTSTAAQDVTVASTSGFIAGNAITCSVNGAAGVVNSITSTTAMNVTFATACTAASQTIAVADKGLNNVTLYFNGSQIGSQQSPTTMGQLTFNLGSQMIIPAGQDSTLEIRADLQQETTSTAYGAGTIVVTLPAESTANAQGQSSQSSISVPAGAVATTGLAIQSGSLAVSKNTAYSNQTVSPNTSGVKIGSFVVQNQGTSEAIRLTTLTVALTSDGSVALGSATTPALTNFSALRTSDTTGSGSQPVSPSATNTFSVNDQLAPGAQMIIDIFANTSSGASGNIVTRLTVASIGVSSNISSAGTITTGQTLSLGRGTMTTPTLVVSTTTPAQYIAVGSSIAGNGGSASATQATFNFISGTASSVITDLKFTVSGSDTVAGASTQTVTSICVAGICGSPVSGVVTLSGLNLAVPVGSGLTQSAQVSYSGVGTSGVTPGTLSTVRLAYVKYSTGGLTKTLGDTTDCTSYVGAACTNAFSPDTVVATTNATLVGSKPTVTIPTASDTLHLGIQNKIGSVTIAADPKGSIKVRRITFTTVGNGFNGSGEVITDTPGTTPFLALAGSSTQLSGNYCDLTADTVNSNTTVCDLGGNGNTTYGNDFIIPAGQSQTFDLYGVVGGTPATTSTTASVSSSVASITWDDTATNGATGSTGLASTLIYGFPTTSYSIHQ